MFKEDGNMDKIRDELMDLSHFLGSESYQLAILGEGNSSAKIPSGKGKMTFLVKASGTRLATMKVNEFVHLKIEPVMKLLAEENPSDETIQNVFKEARVDPDQTLRPSVETLLHAICLNLEGVNFVGHTHPTAVNRLTCSKSFPENLKGRIYPDEIVLLGKESVFIPYTDPGVKLAQKAKKEIEIFLNKHGERPKSIYLQNHGFVALGSTPTEVENITLMADKAAEIRFGALLAGGINTFSEDIVNYIAERTDEKYRQSLFEEQR